MGTCSISGTITGVITGSHDACGGTYTETWTFPSADNCSRGDVVRSRTITVPPAPTITCTSPSNVSLSICSDQDDFDTWLEGFSATGGCNIVVTYDVTIDGILTDEGIDDISGVEAPSSCGGVVQITQFVNGDCNSTDCNSTYRIAAAEELTAICPSPDPESSMTVIDELLTQDSINTLFAAWIDEFGSTGDTCGMYVEDGLSGASAPSFAGGMSEVTFSVSDECSSDECTAQFMVANIGSLVLDMDMQGPETLCPGNAGFVYTVNTAFAAFDVTWEYTGSGGVIMENTDVEVELALTSEATEGMVIATMGVGSNTISDTIEVAFAEALICDEFCRGILDVTTFMVGDPTRNDAHDYSAELLLRSDATIPANREITFSSGSCISIGEGFEVESGALLEAYIRSCDGIGIVDDERHEEAERLVKMLEILESTKKN